MPAMWSRLASVRRSPLGENHNTAASRGRKVQAPGPKTALIESDTVFTPPVQLAFRSAFSIPDSYPKRYSGLSDRIVSFTNRNADRCANLVSVLHEIPLRHFWHVDCGQVGSWPPLRFSTTSFRTRSRVGFGVQQIFSPALLPPVLQETHDERTRGAQVSSNTLEQYRKGRTRYGDVAE